MCNYKFSNESHQIKYSDFRKSFFWNADGLCSSSSTFMKLLKTSASGENYHYYGDNTDQNYDDGNNGNKMATMASLIASNLDYLKLLLNTRKCLEIKNIARIANTVTITLYSRVTM